MKNVPRQIFFFFDDVVKLNLKPCQFFLSFFCRENWKNDEKPFCNAVKITYLTRKSIKFAQPLFQSTFHKKNDKKAG